MTTYTAEQFTPVEDTRHHWRTEDGGLFVGREGQSLADLVIELNTPWEPIPSQADYSCAIQAGIDAKARERGYDNGASLASYVSSTNVQWSAEAEAFVAWRDARWTYALAVMAAVQAGTRAAPPVEDFLAEINLACPFAWPE
ncbi:hypothetical protein ACO2RV_04495 [Ancylobacter sp. VNQ12]|uniref:hypothetical protein n=1 Tax=Ancylobacter sp. VNQ12 TaxID=3400920 RepID=UPI003C0E4043